jgi:hypothetical protein
MKMKLANPKLLTGRHALMLAVTIATLAMIGQAEACTVGGSPSTSASDATVDCTGDTHNSGTGPFSSGYGTPDDTNNIYNIGAGATVRGDNFGISFGAKGKFNVSGTVTGSIVAGIQGTAANVTVTSTGVISGFHALNLRNLTLDNAGQINSDSPNPDGTINVTTANVINRSTGTISGLLSAFGVNDTFDLDNAGTIEATSANGIAIKANIVNVTANAGKIQALAAGGIAIQAVDTVTVSNSIGGLITGGKFGINAATVTVTGNAGTIEATATDGTAIAIHATGTANVSNASTGFGVIQANGAGGIAIEAGTATQAGTVTVNNFSGGVISADKFAINAATVNVTGNAGTIEATGTNGIAIRAGTVNGIVNGTVNVTSNAGTIEATGAGGIGIFAGTVNVTGNTGTISGFSVGIASNNADITNSNLITGGNTGILASDTARVANSRTGTISGNIAIQANGAGGIGSTIVNAGAIISTAGPTGTAIKLSAEADTLTLLSGSRIVGVVDMGGGNDVVNVVTVAPSSKVSSLTTAAALPTFVHFDGTPNTTFSGGGFNGPTVQSGTQLATLDPTALAQADRTLMDFTGGVSSLVQGRLNGVAPSANSAVMAMSYAPEDSHAGPFTKAPGKGSAWLNPAPITVWANSFGGQRTQDATNETLRATSTAWGSAIGIDRKMRPDWLVGAFIGGGAGGLSVDLSSQKVDTDYVFAGGYSRFEWAAHFFDFTLQGGNASSKSDRLVLNNLVAGGSERAHASYNGWFISPEVAYGFRQNIGNGYVLTPTARVRYVAGFFDGYNETGSAQGLSIGRRTLQDFEERGELDVSRVTTFFGGDHSLKTNLHGGVIALQRAGDSTINAVLIGQNLAFTTPGSGSTVGAVAGAGFDYHINPDVAVFGAVEGIAMSDQSRLITAKGGVRAAF